MLLLEIAVILLIIYGVAVASVGRGGELGPARPDNGPVELPTPTQPDDLHALRFDQAWRGYRMEEVDTVLDQLSEQLRERDLRIRHLEDLLERPEQDAGAGAPGSDQPGGAGR